VALSLAMAHRPELLILDEPTSGLDTMVRREFLESMVDIAAEGRTVLLSSHQINEVERVADIVAIVRRGRVLLVEPLDELKASMQELTITVADGLVGPPIVPGEVLRERRRARQWQLVVRGLDEADFERLRLDESIVDVEHRTPALEEIFLAYMQGGVEDLDRDTMPTVPAGNGVAGADS
jgi:ABC-2 type transport system ATP-binding protein